MKLNHPKPGVSISSPSVASGGNSVWGNNIMGRASISSHPPWKDITNQEWADLQATIEGLQDKIQAQSERIEGLEDENEKLRSFFKKVEHSYYPSHYYPSSKMPGETK